MPLLKVTVGLFLSPVMLLLFVTLFAILLAGEMIEDRRAKR
jgi:hypothetical protein